MYRPMISILAAALVTGVLAANPAWAGYKEGVAAYKAKNYELALKEFRKAADGGHAGAQHRLGFMYEKGRGVRTNEEGSRRTSGLGRGVQVVHPGLGKAAEREIGALAGMDRKAPDLG